MEMEISGIKTDKNHRELAEHGSALFPLACYHDSLSSNHVLWHWHDEFEAILITNGCAVITVGKEIFTVKKGEGVFVNSGVMHSIAAQDNGSCDFHSIVFHPKLVSGGIDNVFFRKYLQPVLNNPIMEGVHLTPNIPWHILSLEAMELSWQNCIYKAPGYEFKARNSLSELMFHIWSHLPVPPKQPDTKVVRNSERIKTMLQFIHDNYGTELTTRQIADSVGISESECLRCFRNTISTTPIQYVKQYRIQQAAHMLVFSEDKIADIALKCGFQDISYFTKTFKQLKGCVPTEYRVVNTAEH